MRPTFALCLFALLLAAPLAADEFDDDPHAWRRAEAERKAASADRMQRAWSREVLDPNQQKYDTRYLFLDIAFDPVGETLDGTVAIDLTVTDGPISTVVLDLDAALSVDAVAGAAVAWGHVGDLLTLTLDGSYGNGSDLTVVVEYSGSPDAGHGAFGFDTADGKPLIWSLSEPYGARTWFPVKDTPSDKADSARIHYTVPEPMIAVSNGNLEQVVDLGTTRRFEWFESYPIAIYLVSVAAHEYVEQSKLINTNAGPIPLVNWSYAPSAADALANLDLTEQMMLAFEQDFGPYPFMGEKYGQAQFNWGGGMEHQTATSLCCWNIEFLIAHELGHQWFGDRATCDSFTEIWVNEGFATYSEALWQEDAYGAAAYRDWMRAARFLGPGTVRVPEASLGNTGRIFHSGLSYDKGSWVVHMLRGVLGDADFFTFLQAFLSDPAVSYGTATTADVQRVAEDVSGQDLQTFFDQWIDDEWYPTFRLDWSKTPDGNGWQLDLELAQLQSHRVFVMPVPVRVTTTGGTQDLVLDVDQAAESLVVPLADEPLDVELDPEDWVLKATEPAIPDPSFDRGILLVNGVDIDVYGSEIRNVLNDSSLTGTQPFEFWNLFGPPAGGYPAGLPAPRGEGAVPASVLDDYSTVVWAGNDYNGDAQAWQDAAILDYLQTGGNVVLVARRGQNFLTQLRAEYLGVKFAVTGTASTQDAAPLYPGLVPMSRTGAQNSVVPLYQVPQQPETTFLFEDAGNPNWKLGVWRQPAGGSELRLGGGHFVHLAGRPYRWDRVALRANMDLILSQIIGEPDVVVASPPDLRSAHGILSTTPNPFNPRVRIDFALDRPGRVQITVHDLRGRRVRTLLSARRDAGPSSVVWDGTDARGDTVASGVYTIRFEADGRGDTRKVALVR